jgi:hypothetical protein
MLVEVPVSFGHWKMTTFVAALRKHGITAPLVVDAPMNGEILTDGRTTSYLAREL